MAIDIQDINSIFDSFLNKTITKLTTLYEDTNMEDEHFASMSGNVIASSMTTSIAAHDSIKRGNLIDKQIITEEKKALDIVSTTSVRDEQSAKDLLVKDNDIALKVEQIKMSVNQQSTELKKALDIVSTTSVRNAQSSEDILYKKEQTDLIKKQVLKLIKDTLFVDKQTTELKRSVEFNNQIKALDSYADMIGTMGAGGLVISADMWVTFFALIKSLNDNTVVVKYPESEDTTITKL